MPEWELIESRNISGRGLLRVPADSQKNRAYILYADLIRKPKNAYMNKNYNPDRSKYGFLTFVRNRYVIGQDSMEFPRQAWDGVNDISGQTLLALKCVNNAVLQSLFNLSVALSATPGGQGLQPLNFTNVIAEYVNLRLAWDECRFVCYADTAVSLRLYRLKYDVCNPDFDDDKNSGLPAALPPLAASGAPVQVSPPYDSANNDGGSTAPYSGDTLPPPPVTAGNWLLTFTNRNAPNFSVSYPGVSSDVFTMGVPSPNCSQSGSSRLLKNGIVVPGEDPFNCNNFGFVSTIVSQQFTANP